MIVRFFILFAAILLGACNSYKSKLSQQNEEPVSPAAIDYAFVNAKVFQPRCVRCHSSGGGNKGDVNLETYENVIANIAEIETAALVEQSMPPKRAGGPLGTFEQGILRAWIDAGAPRVAGGETAPKPQPTPELPPPPGPGEEPLPTPPVEANPVVVEPTWDSIYTHIIEPKCVKCHQAGEKAEDYPLTDRAYVTDEANMLVKAGRPDESDIYTAITRTDKHMMPPPKSGITLSDHEKEAIRIWILNGAKD